MWIIKSPGVEKQNMREKIPQVWGIKWMYVPKTLINSDSYEDALYSYYIQKAKQRQNLESSNTNVSSGMKGC